MTAPQRSLFFFFSALLLVLSHCGCQQQDATPHKGPSENLKSATDGLQQRLDDVLEFTFQERHLTLQQHAAWQILHGALVYKRDFLVYDQQRPVAAIDHLLAGGSMRGWDLQPVTVEGTDHRGLRVLMAEGTKAGQGHADQWLAVLAQCELPPSQTIVVEGVNYTIADLVRQVQSDVPRNHQREYSWTLIGLTTYLPTDQNWIASDDQTWSIEQLLRSEVEQDLADSACGGTHQLIGIAMALNRHLQQQGKLTGTWKRADDKIQQAIRLARKHQNPDGSFSTAFLTSRRTSLDLAENLGASGHVLEFLVLAMDDQQLSEPWVQRAAERLTKIFELTKSVDLECGKLYHAAHGLALYRDRIYGARRYATDYDPQP